MKIKIKKYVNKNKKSNAYGKTYGRIQHLGTLDTLDLAKHIQKHGCIFTPDVIVGVLQRFSLCIEELLQDGYKVKLDGLGTFYLTVKTSGEENGDDFGASNIKQVRIQFLADKSKDYEWNSKSQTTRSTFSFNSEETASSGSDSGSGSSGSGGSGNSGSGQEEAGEDRP